MDADLPSVDEHQVVVNAPPEAVWQALAGQFARPGKPGWNAYARAIRVEPHEPSGTMLDVGATVPGFRVTDSSPAAHVALTGRHRFSRYRLVFDLDANDDGTIVRARTYARFPGLTGRAYQTLVIKSGAHRRVTRRLLDAVRSRAESTAAGASP